MNNKRKAYKRKKNTEVSKQSRRFYLLLFIFLCLFFFMNHISKFTKSVSQPAIFSTQDSLNMFIASKEQVSIPQDSVSVTENPDEVILSCAVKLGVPEKLFRSKKKENIVNIIMPINSAKMDLNYANFYLTKTLSKKKWILLSGIENPAGNIQKLTFKPPFQTDQYVISIYYDKSNSYPIEKPKVAIIINELGEKKFNNLLDYLKCPYPLNYAIIPFRKYSKEIYQLIESTSSDILINIPMEDINYPKIDHGKHGIEVKFNEKEIENCLKEQHKDMPQANGSINYLGSLATTDDKIMKATMNYLKANNLYFIDNMTPSSSVAFNVAQKMVLTSYKRHLTLDLTLKKESLKEKITQIQNLGYSSQLIVICIPYSKLNNSQQFLRLCELITQSGYELVNISSMENQLF
ncbi:MAG TPA: divergent polysaccharide deacetylase family protein [Candidatus Cloacimonadota bacterium]|nr:divergent polysaccharide deacetylase family protein [Candidatus Cloacimonadota bacterium]